MAGLPGAIALVPVLVDAGGVLAVCLGGTLALIAAVTAGDAGRLTWPAVPAVPGLALGAWLLVAPGSWGWVGAADLGAYDRGAAAAAAAGLLALAAASSLRSPSRSV